jgi:hypothetical protein
MDRCHISYMFRIACIHHQGVYICSWLFCAEQPRTKTYSLIMDTCYPKLVGDMTTVH